MGDQGAGGGIESHMSAHRRQDSADEPMPTEPAPETRNPPSESDPAALSPLPQDLPRGSRKLSQSASDRGTRVHAHPPQSPGHRHQQATPRPPNPPLEPPVTKATLSELDVQKIVHNPKLRHDINFDPELHFRPNLDGDKGRKKQDKANQFWTILYEQLVMFVVDRDGFHARYGHGDWCLPALLRAVRDIIETLVPQNDRDLLNEGLNVDLLMQQFGRGVADLEKLASWLAGVLKLHCAPMRDEWVDEMYQELSNGNRNNDMTELVKGMRNLLNVLEAMKLDVANHQIRCLRAALIEDTVHFEQRFFVKKLQAGKLSITPSSMWYQAAQDRMERLYAGSQMPYQSAFGEMSEIPPTFVFDEDRVLKLRSDLHDSICLEICMRKFEELERLSRVTLCVPSYVSDEAASNRHSGDFNFMAAGISRPSSVAFSDRSSSNSSSPRSSGIFAPTTSDPADSRSRASELYTSLVALVHTAPMAIYPADRWKGLVGPMALQILRFANAPGSLSLPGFEAQLAACLVEDCDMFRTVEQHFHQRLLADVARRVTEFKNLTSVALFTVAAGGRLPGQSTRPAATVQQHRALFAGATVRQPREPRDEAGVDDMAVRLAHVGVMHWRVWAPVAYEEGGFGQRYG
ncbi:Protein SOSEKI 1 [Collariella sp. IMI 366227]|nr:Protein SOSEKI 1 [Collariella sp. IMI 366227]